MTEKTLLFIALIFTYYLTYSQSDCHAYYPMEEGNAFEMQSFDDKDKLQSISKQKVIKKETSGNNMSATIATEVVDAKGKNMTSGEFKVKCENGVFYIDMQSMLDPNSMGAYKDMEVKVDGDFLNLPTNMEVGQKLNDGKLKMTISSSGMTVMTMTMNVKNRKVEAKEDITTPAGTFSCYKVSSEMETEMGQMMPIKVSIKTVEWFSENTGVVRSESYKSNGKLQGYSILSSLTR